MYKNVFCFWGALIDSEAAVSTLSCPYFYGILCTLSCVTPSCQYMYRMSPFFYFQMTTGHGCFLADELSGLFVRRTYPVKLMSNV